MEPESRAYTATERTELDPATTAAQVAVASTVASASTTAAPVEPEPRASNRSEPVEPGVASSLQGLSESVGNPPGKKIRWEYNKGR